MLNEISDFLFAIAGVSAGFVAILGGFIASRLIAINSELEVAESNLEEVKYQKFLKLEERDMLRRSLDEEDSICYLHEHIDDLAGGLELEDVYEEYELQIVDFERLLPYWKKAQFFIKEFEEFAQKENCSFNNDLVPCELAEENREDPFVYEFLMMYAGWRFSEDFESIPVRPRGSWYEKTKEQVMQANMQAAALDIQEQRYKMDLNRARKPKGMKIGLLIFALFSLFNIIIPLIFSVIALSEQWCEVVMYGCIGTLSIGLGAIFLYLSLMLKPKSLKSEVKDIKKELNI